jgi:hypothetical protein
MNHERNLPIDLVEALAKKLPRVRLSVRAMMALVLLVGGGIGWTVHSARVQRDVVAVILRGGGSVQYDWEVTPTPDAQLHTKPPLGLNPGGRPWAPAWLVRLLGRDYFGAVKSVELGPRAPDAVMAHVVRLGRLECLGANGLTDAGMALLRRLTRLMGLYLTTDSGMSGAALRNLDGLNRLQSLHLRDPAGAVTGADLGPLRGMPDLRYVLLTGPRIDDEALACLSDRSRR